MNDLTIELAFRKFDAENPEVYNLFCQFTRQVIARGFQHYSSDAILHRVRWHTDIETRGDTYKINNNYSSRYARKFANDYPNNADLFRMRELRTA